jgi:hypothetical protein
MNNGNTLNNKTPKWFKDWHIAYFREVRDRSKRNEKLIYAVLATVIAANVLNHFHNEILLILKHFLGS